MNKLKKYNLLKAPLFKKFSVDKHRSEVDLEDAFLTRAGILKKRDPEKERGFLKEKDLWRSQNY